MKELDRAGDWWWIKILAGKVKVGEALVPKVALVTVGIVELQKFWWILTRDTTELRYRR